MALWKIVKLVLANLPTLPLSPFKITHNFETNRLSSPPRQWRWYRYDKPTNITSLPGKSLPLISFPFFLLTLSIRRVLLPPIPVSYHIPGVSYVLRRRFESHFQPQSPSGLPYHSISFITQSTTAGTRRSHRAVSSFSTVLFSNCRPRSGYQRYYTSAFT